MKTFELNQMEEITGSSDANVIVCFIGIGLMTNPATFFWGALIAMTCFSGDSNQ